MVIAIKLKATNIFFFFFYCQYVPYAMAMRQSRREAVRACMFPDDR